MIDAVGFMSEIPVIKNQVLSLLLHDEILMKLVADRPDVKLPALDMRYTHVYPFLYTKGTTTDSKAFITFDTSLAGRTDRDENLHPAIVNLTLEVFAFCHEDLAIIDDAVAKRLQIDDENYRGYRVDLMCMRIDSLLNGAEPSSFGKLKFYSQEVVEPLATDYQGKCNIYSSINANRYGGAL